MTEHKKTQVHIVGGPFDGKTVDFVTARLNVFDHYRKAHTYQKTTTDGVKWFAYLVDPNSTIGNPIWLNKPITAADIEQARAEFERARFEEMQRITAEFREKYVIKDEPCVLEQRAYDLLQRAKARVRRNSEGMGG